MAASACVGSRIRMSEKDSIETRLRRADLVAGIVFVLIVTGAMSYRWHYDNWLAGYDQLTQFMSWFPYLGSRLREYEVPGWNPAIASGMPFAAAPSSGWLYLPAMFWFTFFPAIVAMKVHVFAMCLVGGGATYIFCRRIGIGSLGSLAGSVSYAIGPMIYCITMNLTTAAQVLMFIPIGVLAADGAITGSRWSYRLGWSFAAGIIMIQMLTGSPVRAIYGIGYMAAWMAYRCLFAPSAEVGDRRTHLSRALGSGVAMGVVALAFGTSVLLPQLRYNEQSPVAGANYDNVIGGTYIEASFTFSGAIQAYLQDSAPLRETTLIASQLILVLLAIMFGRNRFGIPIFAAAAIVTIDLSLDHSLLREITTLLPGIGPIIDHNGVASKNFAFFGISMLVAATVHLVASKDIRFSRNPLLKLLPLGGFLALAIWMNQRYDIWLGWWQVSAAIVATWFVILPDLVRFVPRPACSRHLHASAAIGLISLIVIFPTVHDAVDVIHEPVKPLPRAVGTRDFVQLTIDKAVATEDPGTTAEFLQNKQAVSQPFRYAPYTGSADRDQNRRTALGRMFQREIVEILANSRATPLGLQQITQYSPTHITWYDDYMAVMNGTYQDYHYSEVMSPAVDGSPLLDMLNVEYVLVPANLDPQPPIAATWSIAYQDDYAIMYQNPDAFARVWIVHDVQPTTGVADLEQIDSGQVDARTTAFVNGDLPTVQPLLRVDAPDSAFVTDYAQEEITISAASARDGLLVVSEIYENHWSAYVDGEKVDILRTNHALRGIPISAGEHMVVLKYEEPTLTYGLWSTGLTGIAAVGVWVWAGFDRYREKRTVRRQ